MEDTRLGGILLESRIIREEDLEHCLEIQALSNGQRPLGQILVEERLIDRATLDNLLRVQEARRKRVLGSISLEDHDGGYVEAAVAAGASELHLSEGRQPLARVAGELRSLDAEPLAGPEVWQFVREHMGPEMLEEIADRHSVTSDYTRHGIARGRITAFRHSDGIGVNVRLHQPEVRTLEELGLADELREPLNAGKGLILLTGEAGNGLTETFASLLHAVTENSSRRVVVFDDCIEYPEPAGESRVSIRRVGVHTRDYCTGLRSALRAEPDAIFVGDASDPEAFNLALHAAEAGKLVVAVVHASSTTAVLKRVISFYPAYVQARVRSILASVTNAAAAVRLIPSIDREKFHLAAEVLRFGDGVRELVRSGSIEKLKLLMRLDGEGRGFPMDESLLHLLNTGQASFSDVFPYAQDKSLFLRSIDGVGEASNDG